MLDLPSAGERRLAARVTKDAMRQIRGGHPWVYGNSIESISHEGRAGDLAVVFDQRRRFAAIGLWDPSSPIPLRILHQGSPTPIDEEFWRNRLRMVLQRRQALVDSGTTTGIRLIHGENDALPSLVLDRYGTVGVLKLYSPAWFPHLATILPLVEELTGLESLVLRLARNVASGETFGLRDGTTIVGAAPPEPVEYLENGLVFTAHPSTGQKTGAFLDQRDNRALIRRHSAGADVLDVFSYAGGFSVHAASGGARSVHSVDQSPHAIATSIEHVQRNSPGDPAVARVTHSSSVGDAFEVMEEFTRRGRRFDVVIIDPPSFAQRQASVPGALRSYGRLTALGLGLVEPGGLLFQASCSSRVPADTFYEAVSAAAAAGGHSFEPLAQTAHPEDHPIGFPEGAYLKAVLARIAR